MMMTRHDGNDNVSWWWWQRVTTDMTMCHYDDDNTSLRRHFFGLWYRVRRYTSLLCDQISRYWSHSSSQQYVSIRRFLHFECWQKRRYSLVQPEEWIWPSLKRNFCLLFDLSVDMQLDGELNLCDSSLCTACECGCMQCYNEWKDALIRRRWNWFLGDSSVCSACECWCTKCDCEWNDALNSLEMRLMRRWLTFVCMVICTHKCNLPSCTAFTDRII